MESSAASAAWDRTVDIAWQRPLTDTHEEKSATEPRAHHFTRALKRLESYFIRRSSQINESPYLHLPDAIRFQVAQHIISPHEYHTEGTPSKPVRLTHSAYDRDVWPPEYFESLQDLHSRLSPYLAVCNAFRQDILAALMLTQRFRMTVSPHVGRLLDNHGFLFLERYGPLMSYFTLDVDLSKLGFGPDEMASNLARGTFRVTNLVRSAAESLSVGRFESLSELTLLVRRYYGIRPDGSPYCSDDHLSILDTFEALAGKVKNLRMVGCNNEFVIKTIRALWRDCSPDDDDIAPLAVRTTPSSMYPLLPTQSSYLDFGVESDGIQLFKHNATFHGLWGVELDETAMGAKRPRQSTGTLTGSFMSGMSESQGRESPQSGVSTSKWRTIFRSQGNPQHLLGHPALRPAKSMDSIATWRRREACAMSTARPDSQGSQRSERNVLRKAPKTPKSPSKLKKRVFSRGTPLERGFG